MIKFLGERLTAEQIDRVFFRRKPDTNYGLVCFPGAMAFRIYSEPFGDYTVFHRPWNKHIKDGTLIVKEKHNHFYRVNFYYKPHSSDFWLMEMDLRYRGIVETFITAVFLGLFYLIKNKFRKPIIEQVYDAGRNRGRR